MAGLKILLYRIFCSHRNSSLPSGWLVES
jgi:hypothetical protein